jgi:hypothetical protein
METSEFRNTKQIISKTKEYLYNKILKLSKYRNRKKIIVSNSLSLQLVFRKARNEYILK